MAKLILTLSANAGVSICFGGAKIWVDALHCDTVPGFSTIDKRLLGKMLQSEAFMAPDVICCTHCHGDHFSREMIDGAARMWQDAKVLLPEEQIIGDRFTYRVKGVEMEFLRLPHEGEQYRDVVHYGLLLTGEGKRVLLSGDCRRCAPELAEAVCGKQIDAAVLDFPWLTLKNGREFLRERLPARHYIGYHLPFAADDTNGFRRSAEKAAAELNAILLMDPLQSVELEL